MTAISDGNADDDVIDNITDSRRVCVGGPICVVSIYRSIHVAIKFGRYYAYKIKRCAMPSNYTKHSTTKETSPRDSMPSVQLFKLSSAGTSPS